MEVAGGSGDYLQNISHVPGAGQGWLRRGLRMSGKLPFLYCEQENSLIDFRLEGGGRVLNDVEIYSLKS